MSDTHWLQHTHACFGVRIRQEVVSKFAGSWTPGVALSAAPGETYNSDTFAGHMRLGQAYLQSKESGKALSEFECAVGLNPDSAPARYNLGATPP